MSEAQNEITQWKQLWQLMSGIHYSTPKPVVREQLENVSKHLLDGLAQFRPNSAASDEKLKKILTQSKQEKLLKFTQRLQQFLDLDAMQTWDVLQFYLLNEYKGTASSLSSCISTESAMLKLLNDIWVYYTLERMVMLRVVKTMLEFRDSQVHPYAEEFREVIGNIKIEKILKSYIEQFENSVKEVPVKAVPGDLFNSMAKLTAVNERKLREQIVILQILTLCICENGIQANDLKRLVEVFHFHSFGKQQLFLQIDNAYHAELVQRLTNYEVALLLRVFDYTGDSQTWIRDVISSLESRISKMYQSPEHGPLLLCWMLLNFRSNDVINDDEAANKCRQYGVKALSLKVFDYLYQMVQLSDFSDNSKLANAIQRAIFNHISFLCELFEGDGSVSQHQKVFDILKELLKSRVLSGELLKDETPIRTIFDSAMEVFPCNFENLTKLASSLALSDTNVFRWIKSTMEELPVYTEPYQNINCPLHTTTEPDVYILGDDYKPFRGVDFTVPKGTEVIIADRKTGTTMHFRAKLNFYQALQHEMNELLRETVQYSQLNPERVDRVTIGLEYLANVLKRITCPSEVCGMIVHPTEMVFDLLMKFRQLQVPPITLMATCLNVCTALIPLVEQDIVTRLNSLNILPKVGFNHLDYKAYANGASFDAGLVGNYLVNIEKSTGKYEFLQAYFDFLEVHAKLPGIENVWSIELPGLVFVLREVFPHVNRWKFQSTLDKQKIFSFVLKYFIDILQPAHEIPKQWKILKQVCISSLHDAENGMTLLKFIAVGNSLLQSIMENESNWMNAPKTGVNYIMQLSMTCLMHILRLKREILETGSESLTHLESTIYMQPKQIDTLRIIPVVTSYIGNIFNPRLPNLAYRLLRRFALEFQMSLLACLDMEPDQIRQIFLQRLQHNHENVSLKETILEFVEACIQKQPGLTVAFFKNDEKKELFFGNKTEKKRVRVHEERIIDYMEEHLELIAKEPESLNSPLISRTMTLFHSLWKNNMQNLASELSEKDKFWQKLCTPLFEGKIVNRKACAQLFNILGIEVFRINAGGTFNPDLKEVLTKFLQKANLSRWLDEAFTFHPETSSAPKESADWLSLLQNLKDVVVLILRNRTLEIPGESREVLAKKSMEALIQRTYASDDLRPMIIISEFYFIIYCQLRPTLPDYSQIERLLAFLANYYADVHVRAKEAILSIAIKTLTSDVDSVVMVQKLLESVVLIVSLELHTFETTANNEKRLPKMVVEPDRMVAMRLSVTLLHNITKLLEETTSTGWIQCLKQNKLLNRILSCLSTIVQMNSRRKIASELLDLLVAFANGPCSRDLAFCDVGEYLWLKLLPPKDLLHGFFDQKTTDTNAEGRWKSKDWWPIYTKGITLVTRLLQKHEHSFKKDAIFFVGVQEEFLLDSLLLIKQSLEPDAIDLIKMTLELGCELSTYEEYWRLEHPQSLNNFLKCTQILMDSAVSLLYRPRILKKLAEGSVDTADHLLLDSATVDSTDEIVAVMNELIEIISMCAKCLLSFSPKLLDLLCEPEFLPSKWNILIEIQFGTPKIILDGYPQLSFGSLMSSVSIFTKALNLQHYSFQDTPINILPCEDVDQMDMSLASPIADTSGRLTGSAGHSLAPTRATSLASSPKTHFSKSLSMTSVTSYGATSEFAPSNELLSHLDAQMCVSALELVLTFLGSQSLLALKHTHLSQREKQLIRRELATELNVFHEFVRKRICRDGRAANTRKKYGIFEITNTNNDDPTPPPIIKTAEHARSLRVNVVKKLHESKHPSPFDMSAQFSPIPKPIMESTPRRGILKDTNSTSIKRQVTFTEDADLTSSATGKKLCAEEDDPMYFEPEDPVYTGLSYVKMVEEDYLHFLSNLFLVICLADN